ncbi:MAG: hypothetical protein E3J25_04060 [Anaerolineales bacterium]|nr:MAG: hypothetical protein E3J25_04060 [Anaerolineales bacterium]
MSISDIFAPRRLEPWQPITAKLYEIADRIADQAASGQMSTETITVGTEWTAVVGNWVACDLYVDSGSADVYVRLVGETGSLEGRPWQTGEAPLRSGEHLPVRLGARKYSVREVLTMEGLKEEIVAESPTIWMICQAGTATVRVFKLW